jgi:hypothetical protein
MFETLVSALADTYGLKVDWRRPTGGGRAAVYLRDYGLVDDADYVEAFFAHDRVMEGGTGHVVEAALNRDKRVYGWVVTEGGRVERVGEIEPPLPGSEQAWRVDR